MANAAPATYAAARTTVSAVVAASRSWGPPVALNSMVAGIDAARMASVPTADTAARRGRAKSTAMTTIWASHVPNPNVSTQAAANRLQPLASPMSAATAKPSGGQPRSASPIRVVGPPPIGRMADASASGSAARRSDGSEYGGPSRAAASAGAGSGGAAPAPAPAGWDSISGAAPPRRRALAWYSGPCLRGSAYSFGLIVQYVPLVVPYQEAPDHSGSYGSCSAKS